MWFLLVSISIFAALFLFVFPVLLMVITRARKRAGLDPLGCGVVLGALLLLWFSAVLAMGPPSGGELTRNTEQHNKLTESKQPDGGPNQRSRASANEQQQGTLKEPECSNEGQSNYYDCLIQLRTARATVEQAYWAKISAWLSALGLLFATVAAAVALSAMWTIRSTVGRGLRAHVAVHPETLELNGKAPAVLNFRITNTGQTPAYNVMSFDRFHFLPFPLPATYNVDVLDNDSAEISNLITARETKAVSRLLGKSISAAMEAQLRADNHRWYMFVHVRYRDVFCSEVRTTRLCASLPGPQLMAYLDAGGEGPLNCKWDYEEKHNSAD